MERNGGHVIAIEEDKYQPLADSIIGKLNRLTPLNSACCIFTVPDRLRSVKEKAYTPKTVSIGPLHHGKQEHLKAMEEQKKWYLNAFVRTHEHVPLYVKIIKDKEQELRNCYFEALDEFKVDDFVEMMLVDGAFIIEVLTRFKCGIQEENDCIFNNPFLIQDIWSDLLLLENQLPFFLLEDLYDLKNKLTNSSSSTSSTTTIIELFYHYVGDLEIKPLKQICAKEVLHFVDLLRKLYIPLNNSRANGKSLKNINIPTITKLHQAGMKFKSRSSMNIFDISFKNGILEIPKIVMNHPVEIVLRNILAFEQSHCYTQKNYLNDYVSFIDSLIDTAEDVDLLVKHEILENWSDSSEMANLINKLSIGVVVRFKEFYFAEICDDLNLYYRGSWHHWKAILKQKYFNTPWASISVIAAVILLVLTFIQAVCSILSVPRWWKELVENLAGCHWSSLFCFLL